MATADSTALRLGLIAGARRLVSSGLTANSSGNISHRVAGGFLVQSRDAARLSAADLKIDTRREPTPTELADMLFKAHATSQADFDAWVAKVKASPKHLGLDNYADLAKQSEKDPVQYFSGVEPVLFTAVLDKYMDKSSGLKLADKICLPTKDKVVARAAE